MDTSNLRQEIETSLGRFPAIFQPALDQPEVLASLWASIKTLYLNNPSPPLFKEKLLARLGRYCPSSYCLVSHSVSLHAQGMKSSDIWDLLKKPAPSIMDEVPPSAAAAGPGWPEPNSPAETRLLELIETSFLHPGGPEKPRAELRKLAGPENLGAIWQLTAFARIMQSWTDVQREITVEDDPALKDRAEALSVEEPMLADFFRNYTDMVQRERQTLEDRLVNEITHRRQMQEELTRYVAEMEESRDRVQEQATQMTKLAEELYKRREELLIEVGERKKAEESIRVYAEIVRNMPLGLNVWRLENPNDPRSFRLLATNPSVKRFTGADLETSIGKSMIEFLATPT
jgi:PAS domain-containing protein